MTDLLDVLKLAQAARQAEVREGDILWGPDSDLRMQNEVIQIKSSEADRHKEYLSCKIHINASLENCLSTLTDLEQELLVTTEGGEVTSRLETKFIDFLTHSQKKLSELQSYIAAFDQEKTHVEKQIQKAKSSIDHKEIIEIMEVLERTYLENSILNSRLAMEEMANDLLSENVNVTIGKAKNDKQLAGKLLTCQHKLSDEIEGLKREIHRANILAVI